MGTVYAFFADGFEEIEAFTAIDTLRRAGLNVEIVSVTPDEIVVGAHDVSVLCDINFENCDFFDAELLLLPGGMPGAATLDKHEGLRKLILSFQQPQLTQHHRSSTNGRNRFTFCGKIKNQFTQPFVLVKCGSSRHSSR